MITKRELKGLVSVLNFYLLGGFSMGITAAVVASIFGSTLTRANDGMPLPSRAITAIIVILIGVATSLLAFGILLPAELKIIRRNLKPELLAQRLSRGRKNRS